MVDLPETLLLDTARSWLEAEPDGDIRTELAELIATGEGGQTDELAEGFSGRL